MAEQITEPDIDILCECSNEPMVRAFARKCGEFGIHLQHRQSSCVIREAVKRLDAMRLDMAAYSHIPTAVNWLRNTSEVRDLLLTTIPKEADHAG